MFLQPIKVNETSLFCDYLNKHNLSNYYKKSKFTKILVDLSTQNISNKKIVKSNFFRIVLYSLGYILSGHKPLLKYIKRRNNYISQLSFNKKTLLALTNINIVNIFYENYFIYDFLLPFAAKRVFKKIIKYYKYSESFKKIRKS